jgi:hypothetical protein
LAAADDRSTADERARLLGVADATLAAIGARRQWLEQETRDRAAAALTRLLGAERLREEMHRGATMQLDDALDAALAAVD